MPPRRLVPDVPRALDAICFKALAADPRERFGAPAEPADALRQWLDRQPTSAWKRLLRRESVVAAPGGNGSPPL